jgi:ribosomal protein S18 acetylase RimI-like enzyme
MTVDLQIRAFIDTDLDPIVELSLLAWEPVFASFRKVLGPEIYPILYPDWCKSQAEGVAQAIKERPKNHVLVAELDGTVVGFLAYDIHEKNETGEVILLAVHPDDQNSGIGTELNLVALEQMKAAGLKMAEVGTGGDEGHAPARRSYEKTGYTALPLVRYYKAL